MGPQDSRNLSRDDESAISPGIKMKLIVVAIALCIAYVSADADCTADSSVAVSKLALGKALCKGLTLTQNVSKESCEEKCRNCETAKPADQKTITGFVYRAGEQSCMCHFGSEKDKMTDDKTEGFEACFFA